MRENLSPQFTKCAFRKKTIVSCGLSIHTESDKSPACLDEKTVDEMGTNFCQNEYFLKIIQYRPPTELTINKIDKRNGAT